jgi:Ca2+-binding RTX toxin-like protein
MLGDVKVLFSDDFKAPLNDANWGFPTGDASFLGRTQMRPGLSPTTGGMLRLKLDTWLDGKAFSGSEVFTKQEFGLENGGIGFEVRARFTKPVKGAVAGIFPYKFNPDTKLHDEIDWEALGNDWAAGRNTIQTNVYANEPFGSGKVTMASTGSAVSEWHTYRIEWMKDKVQWFVDGRPVRTETTKVPQGDMALHLNIWAPDKAWVKAYDASLKPAQKAGDNQSYFFDIDYVKVTQLAVALGGPRDEVFTGTELNDRHLGKGGDDRLYGFAGNDVLHGGDGNDRIYGGADKDRLYGNEGKDWLNGRSGSDLLRGGPGADTFTFRTDLDRAGIDRLPDFKPDKDIIRLKVEVFEGIGAPGPLAKEAFHKGKMAGEEDDRIIYHAGSGELDFDADGSGPGAPVHFATLAVALDLSHRDFTIF